jgi:twitching motility protein PilT
LVLVTGPTGSGKSTTLAALVDLANRTRKDHIMTVEDPIEFLHRNKSCLVNQREVGEDTKSFANALKHVLRQDPDIILVGEMRDLETISVALTAAETGHLVFATLHTQDAAQTIDRVIDVFPPHQQQQVRVQLAGAIQGVVCQTLCKTADGKGRVAATEVMFATPAIRNLIREGKTHQIYSSMQAGAQHGMQTMDQNLAELVKARRITMEDALEKCHHLDDFKRLTNGGM